METLDINEIKKDLYKSKAMAKLMYYNPENGDLIYNIQVGDRLYTFPIHTVSPAIEVKEFIEKGVHVKFELDVIKLTDDLKGARFEPEIKGSALIRWITQAINAGEFV